MWAEFCPYLALGNYVILFYDSEMFLQHLRHPEKLNLHKTQHVLGENILFCNVNWLAGIDRSHVLLYYYYYCCCHSGINSKMSQSYQFVLQQQACAVTGKILILGESSHKSAAVNSICFQFASFDLCSHVEKHSLCITWIMLLPCSVPPGSHHIISLAEPHPL